MKRKKLLTAREVGKWNRLPGEVAGKCTPYF